MSFLDRSSSHVIDIRCSSLSSFWPQLLLPILVCFKVGHVLSDHFLLPHKQGAVLEDLPLPAGYKHHLQQ